MEERIIQITSGQGPAECCWVVYQLTIFITRMAEKAGLEIQLMDSLPGSEENTFISSRLIIRGDQLESFISEWEGTILWIGQSMYRKNHPRKNWYVGLQFKKPVKQIGFNEDDILFQAIRSGGPGGQHVNKVSTAIRAIHIPTGISVHVSDTRSQLQNKQLAIKRLQEAIAKSNLVTKKAEIHHEWNLHHDLVRGNPVKTFKGSDFKLVKIVRNNGNTTQ
jgi:peptide chain release factor